ncbi:hypothetical protein Naga_103285g1, partial [Nannochloropsis gaditana]
SLPLPSPGSLLSSWALHGRCGSPSLPPPLGKEALELIITWMGKAGLWGEALRLLHDEGEMPFPFPPFLLSSSRPLSIPPASILIHPSPPPSSLPLRVGPPSRTMYQNTLRACAVAARGSEAKSVILAMRARGLVPGEREHALGA